jgi:D-serine deaminase-like pyridoxal phosphate-dependent protein
MAPVGIRDILIANQIIGPQKVARLAALRRHADPIGLTMLSTIISRPTPTRVVTDSGRKAMMIDDHGEPWPKGETAVRSVRISSEHGQYEIEAPSANPRIGDKLEGLVAYGDMTLFLHDELFGI